MSKYKIVGGPTKDLWERGFFNLVNRNRHPLYIQIDHGTGNKYHLSVMIVITELKWIGIDANLWGFKGFVVSGEFGSKLHYYDEIEGTYDTQKRQGELAVHYPVRVSSVAHMPAQAKTSRFANNIAATQPSRQPAFVRRLSDIVALIFRLRKTV